MSPYESIGEVATKVLVKAAESWPKAVGLQSERKLEIGFVSKRG